MEVPSWGCFANVLTWDFSLWCVNSGISRAVFERLSRLLMGVCISHFVAFWKVGKLAITGLLRKKVFPTEKNGGEPGEPIMIHPSKCFLFFVGNPHVSLRVGCISTWTFRQFLGVHPTWKVVHSHGCSPALGTRHIRRIRRHVYLLVI